MADTAEKSARQKQIEERRAYAAKCIRKIARVRVMPARDDIRWLLKHPNGTGFPADGPAEWPLDKFTRRRLREGSVTRVEGPQPEQEKEKPKGKAERAPPAPPTTEKAPPALPTTTE